MPGPRDRRLRKPAWLLPSFHSFFSWYIPSRVCMLRQYWHSCNQQIHRPFFNLMCSLPHKVIADLSKTPFILLQSHIALSLVAQRFGGPTAEHLPGRTPLPHSTRALACKSAATQLRALLVPTPPSPRSPPPPKVTYCARSVQASLEFGPPNPSHLNARLMDTAQRPQLQSQALATFDNSPSILLLSRFTSTQVASPQSGPTST